jgi:hypothetical protein
VLAVNRLQDLSIPLNVGIVAAVVVTHRAEPKASHEFWLRVLRADNVKLASPQWELFQGLHRNAHKRGGGQHRDARDFALCMRWWQARRLATTGLALTLAKRKMREV